MTKQRYLVQAYGRRVGAIGINHRLAVFVDAENPDAAILAAYEHVEHLSGITVQLASEANLDGRCEVIETKPKT